MVVFVIFKGKEAVFNGPKCPGGWLGRRKKVSPKVKF